MQDLRLKTQNYARSTLKNAKLRKILQDLGLKRKVMQDLCLKTQSYARSTLKNAKLCNIYA